MKNMVLVTTKYPKGAGNEWLTNELAEYASARGNTVSVVALSWEFDDGASEHYTANGANVIRFRMPRIFYKKNLACAFLKIFSFSLYARFKTQAIMSQADIIIASTPCIATWAFLTGHRLKDGVKSTLILWDFFPYYMKGLWRSKNIFFSFFLTIENYLYKKFNFIGCMTNANKRFLLENYDNIDITRVFNLPLWTRQVPEPSLDKTLIRTRYEIAADAFVVIYGGAMSPVQGLDCMIDLAELNKTDKTVLFLMVGRGPERARLQEQAIKKGLTNLRFLEYIPRDQYEELVYASDLGIISLSSTLEVPSFRSKSIDYLKVGLPILASLDDCTDFGDILVKEMQAGQWVRAGDSESLNISLQNMKNNKDFLASCGKNGRAYYEKNMSVVVAYENIFERL